MYTNNIDFLLKMVYRVVLCSTALLFINLSVYSQTSSSSPYSRYGIGQISSIGTAQNFMLGGSGTAVSNGTYAPLFINPNNPASYTGSYLTLFEAGILSNTTKLQNKNASTLTNNTSVNYLNFLVPVNKWWGSCIGLNPYSNVGYNISDSGFLATGEPVDYAYEGSGGISRLYWGNAIAPFSNRQAAFKKSDKYKRLLEEKNTKQIAQINRRIKALSGISIGVNTSYLFGSYENTRRVIFHDTSGAYNFRTSRTTRLNNLVFNYGFQYSLTIDSVKRKNTYYTADSVRKDTTIRYERNNKIKITAGFTLKTNSTIRATNDLVSYTYQHNSSYINNEQIKDTIENYTNIKGDITLPMELSYGISVRGGEKWMLCAEYGTQKWSGYSFFGENAQLKNAMNASMGFSYVPNFRGESKAGKSDYFQRVNYRAGLRYAQTPIELKNTRITETAFSIGVGLPSGRLRQSTQLSVLNIGFEFGKRGTVNNGLIQENFANILIGFTMNDRWFLRPKFD